MLITLKDRQYWIDYCAELIMSIDKKRSELDLEYEKEWRKRKWPYKDRLDSQFPPHDYWHYPSHYGHGTLTTATRLKKILEDTHVGDVQLTHQEHETLKA
jgi:hypothetical protein